MPTQRREEKRVEECSSARGRERERERKREKEKERKTAGTPGRERVREKECLLTVGREREKEQALTSPFICFFPPPVPALCKLGLDKSVVCSS